MGRVPSTSMTAPRALTWLQQQPLDGDVEEASEPLVLLLGAEEFTLVLHYRVSDGAEDLLTHRCQPVVHKHGQRLQSAHVCSAAVSRGDVLLFTSTLQETPAPAWSRHSGCHAPVWTGDYTAPHSAQRCPEKYTSLTSAVTRMEWEILVLEKLTKCGWDLRVTFC